MHDQAKTHKHVRTHAKHTGKDVLLILFFGGEPGSPAVTDTVTEMNMALFDREKPSKPLRARKRRRHNTTTDRHDTEPHYLYHS